ncbi:MAG: uroporphyrinogen decarboxylase family protein [Chloroflexota bacterium]|nr:uroporphyrinogen decarboxylase family protein [Chloroflexota bacterium]
MIPRALWYLEFGYEGALMTLALHPDRYRKLIQFSAEKGRLRATIIARAIREGIHSGAILTGEDICSQRGPLVSPDYLRREYFPLVEYALEPLLEVGAKIVWHCDGNYRPLLDDVLACNISGLQGFQQECGMDIEWIVERRTRNGDPLLIFGPLSVTTTLPYGTPDDVRAEVHRAMALCRDKASLVFFSSNTITPDVPLENIQTFWQTVLESTW